MSKKWTEREKDLARQLRLAQKETARAEERRVAASNGRYALAQFAGQLITSGTKYLEAGSSLSTGWAIRAAARALAKSGVDGMIAEP